MDPRHPQYGASHSDHGFQFDEATRASFQHADLTSTFPLHGHSAYVPDSWMDNRSSTNNPARGQAPSQYPNQTSGGPIYAPPRFVPITRNGRQSSDFDRTELQAPGQSENGPSTSPLEVRTVLTPDTSYGRQSSAVDPIEGAATQGADQTLRYTIHAPSIPTPGTSNLRQESAVPPEEPAPAQSPQLASACPIYAPQVLIPAVTDGSQALAFDATHVDHRSVPTAAEVGDGGRQPQATRLQSGESRANISPPFHPTMDRPSMPGRPVNFDVPRQQEYQPQDLPPVSRSRTCNLTDGTRAGPLQYSSALYAEQGAHAQTQHLYPRNSPSPNLAGAAADNPLVVLDANDNEGEGNERERSIPQKLSPPVRPNRLVQRPDPAFQHYNARSYSSEQGSTSHTGTPYLQRARGQVSSSSDGRLNIPSYRLPTAVPQEEAETADVNRRKRSRNTFERDDHYTPAVAGASYGPTFAGGRPPSDSASEGSGSKDNIDDDDDVDADEEEYGDFGIRYQPPKRRRLANGGVAQDRPTYPINDYDDTNPATFPIDDGPCPSRQTYPISPHSTYPVNDVAGASSGFHAQPEGAHTGMLVFCSRVGP